MTRGMNILAIQGKGEKKGIKKEDEYDTRNRMRTNDA
jgi:hypothetical protein